ncbi:hypothetical protein BH11BAC1_BH11BAC1_10620 [soil metagenome]
MTFDGYANVFYFYGASRHFRTGHKLNKKTPHDKGAGSFVGNQNQLNLNSMAYFFFVNSISSVPPE